MTLVRDLATQMMRLSLPTLAFLVACVSGVSSVPSPWELDPPVGLHCPRTTATEVTAACTVDPAVADMVSFMVARTDDPRRWPFAQYSFIVSPDSDGKIEATLTGLTPSTSFFLLARSHKRGQVIGYFKKWSNVSHHNGVCQTAAAEPTEDDLAGKQQRSALQAPMSGPRTRWMEVYRRNGPTAFSTSTSDPMNNYTLPDFLQDHNTFNQAPSDPAELFGVGVSNASWSRYCAELADVTFDNVTTPGFRYRDTRSHVPTVTSGFADYLSCNAGVCECMLCGDRVVFLNHEQMKEQCPTTPAQAEWVEKHYKPEDTSVPLKQKEECIYDPEAMKTIGTRQCLCPNLAQSRRYVGLALSLVSFPSGGMCPPGASVGDDGCTWREYSISHSVSEGRLIELGTFDPAKSYDERVEITNRAFQMAGARPCGEHVGQLSTALAEAPLVV